MANLPASDKVVAQVPSKAQKPRVAQASAAPPPFADQILLPCYAMLWTIFAILLVLWLLGLVTSYTLRGFIHILLVVAIAVALVQIVSGRRAI